MSSSYYDIGLAFRYSDWVNEIKPELCKQLGFNKEIKPENLLEEVLDPDDYFFKDDCIVLLWYEYPDWEEDVLYPLLEKITEKYECDYALIDDNCDYTVIRNDLRQITIQGNDLLVDGMPFLRPSLKLNSILVKMLQEHGCSKEEICDYIEKHMESCYCLKRYHDFLFNEWRKKE